MFIPTLDLYQNNFVFERRKFSFESWQKEIDFSLYFVLAKISSKLARDITYSISFDSKKTPLSLLLKTKNIIEDHLHTRGVLRALLLKDQRSISLSYFLQCLIQKCSLYCRKENLFIDFLEPIGLFQTRTSKLTVVGKSKVQGNFFFFCDKISPWLVSWKRFTHDPDEIQNYSGFFLSIKKILKRIFILIFLAKKIPTKNFHDQKY